MVNHTTESSTEYSTVDAGDVGAPGFPGELTVQSIPELARCSVEELNATFARARVAVALAKLGAAHAVNSTRTIAFISLLGR